MADLIEALHNLARERARGGPSPLVALRRIPARPGARISHLGISQRLSQAWVSVTGEPFRPHQSLALSALRRAEPLALVGGDAARQTLHLLSLELLRSEAPATALLLAPDEQLAAAHRGELERLVRALGEPLRVGVAHGGEARAAMGAQLVIATPQALHGRLLRHHERAWAPFWARLRLILVADAQRYSGVAAPHLGWLLQRAARLADPARRPQLAATVGPCAGIEEALALIGGESWRVIPAEDGPSSATAMGYWRAGGERMREAAVLALGLARAGASVHVCCDPLEAGQIQALVGADVAAVSVGAGPLPAQAQILVGVELGARYLRQCLDSAQLSLLLLGEEPAERTVVRLAGREREQLPLADGAPPQWVAAPGNAYVAAQHLVCAAAERPLGADELAAWGAESIAARLEEQGRLAQLPDRAWQPLTDGDGYAAFGLPSAGEAPATVRDLQSGARAALDAAAFERWGFPGAALPPLRGGFRVVGRDEGALELEVRPAEQRRTMPLRRCTLRVRDEREQRLVRGCKVGWGRVTLDEEVYGFRELTGGNAPAERALNPALGGSLAAPACWIELQGELSPAGQLVGWSLAAALPLRTTLGLADLVPAYDAAARRIYFVDAQPGGNGASAWLFTNVEELLPCAYDIALECRSDPLLEPVARADSDWLLALLAGEPGQAAPQPSESHAPTRPVPPPRQEPPREEVPAPARPVPPPRQEPPRREEPPVERVPSPRREEPRRQDAPAPRREPPASPPRPAPAPRPEEPPAERVAPQRQELPREEVTAPTRPVPPPRQELPRREEPPVEQLPSPRREPPASPPRPAPAPRREEPPAERVAPPRREEPVAPPRRDEPPQPTQPPLPLEPEAPTEAPRRPRREIAPREEPLPDASAMVARLRRLREQRSGPEPPRRPSTTDQVSQGEPRFRAGDTIVCAPYGRGEVVASRVEGERELLLVAFEEHGELTVDAVVNAVRLDERAPVDDEDTF